ncbi:MAG: bifunctional pyr operon transcriptional regulator/uracil phosphoribosyltransferase PyrR [Desulfovibrio sp.]|nr:bifunctional pyr operon transcriptional regulator/uracil phosphoribosyltransferase PyrR [Desulfovibrio sp.]
MGSITILEAEEIDRILERLTSQLHERHAAGDDLMLVGIERRGVDLARRLVVLLEKMFAQTVPLGSLDINLYRDDWTSLEGKPHIGQSRIPESVDGRTIVLVDDVLFTGRTIRAALEALLDYGRPRVVELLVLIDRGHRELPIHADYVGRSINTARQEHVDVLLRERDGQDTVRLGAKA